MARRNFFHRTQMRQRQNRGRENPYFRHGRKVPWKGVGILTLSVTLLSMLLGFLFAHPALDIQTVNVEGLESIDRTAFEGEVGGYLNERTLLFFHRSNQFLFSLDQLQQRLEQAFTFASLVVTRSGKGLTIVVHERTSNLIWRADKEYVVDLSGISTRLFNREALADAELALDLPIFYDTNEVAVHIGEPVLTAEEIRQVFSFHKILVSQGILYTETHVNRLTGGWMSIVTQVGYEIYFDVTGDVEVQGERLKTVLATQIEDPETLQYIDVRFGDHVYFK